MKLTEKKNQLSQQRSKLSALLKAPSGVPIQEIRPVQEKEPLAGKIPPMAPVGQIPPKKEFVSKEVHVNFKAEEKFMERVWIHAARTRMTLKQIAITAFSEYLDRNQPSD
ncbi:hypothetical protein GCM10027299_52560 [Larkinella ripae]